MTKSPNPSEQLKQFLDFVDESRRILGIALDAVQTEEKRQIDLLHEIEFAASAKERNKTATRLHKCREDRRKYKDMVKRYEQIVNFFNDGQNQKITNQMKQLLGRQRREEEYLDSDRVYKKRV